MEKFKQPKYFSFPTYVFMFKWKLCTEIPGKATFLKHYASSEHMHRQCLSKKKFFCWECEKFDFHLNV